MKQLIMSGKVITSPQRFQEYFSPEDFLWNPQEAAGFAMQQLRPLSAWYTYHTELLFRAVFLNRRIPETPETYFRKNDPAASLPGVAAVLQQMQNDPVVQKTLDTVWQVALGTSLDPQAKSRLFCILAAGYLLSRKDPEEYPISASAAQSAYLREKAIPEDLEWYSMIPAEEIFLRARPEPYRILLWDGDHRDSADLSLCQFIALPHVQGSTALPVVLLLYQNSSDPEPQRIEIFPGDYRYGIFTQDFLVTIHPIQVRNGNCIMERCKDILQVFLDDVLVHQISCVGKKIISFAPQDDGKGWIIIERTFNDYSHYCYERALGSRLPRKHAVEVQMQEKNCFILTEKGRLVSNLARYNQKKDIASLQYFFRGEKA